MSQSSRRSSQQADSGLLEPLLWLGMGVIALSCALPALVVGLVAERLLRERSWSMLLWLALAVLGLGSTTVLAFHGLGQLVALQFETLIWEAKVHQTSFLQWDLARLWSRTWPIWLQTLALAPVIAAFRGLAAQLHRGGAAVLLHQEHQRQLEVEHAQRRTARRLQRRRPLPDEINGQMVIGIPIDDEWNR